MTREISRQAFVRGALGAVAAGALLGSCRPTAPDLQAPPAAPGSQSPPKASGPQDWNALASGVSRH